MKPKRKTAPTNLLVRFWREFLFTRAFEFETELPLEQCTVALRRITETTRLSWGSSEELTISIDESQLPYTFHAERQRKQKNRDLTPIILVDGMIDWDADSSKTLVSGTARFAPAYYMGLLGMIALWLIMMLAPMPSSSSQLVMGFLIIAACVFWWSLYWSRNNLVASLEQVVRDAEKVVLVSKRKVDASLSDVDVWADSFPSQKSNR